MAKHIYEFQWSDSAIKWYVECGTNISTNLRRFIRNLARPGVPWPMQAGRVMVNFWSGTSAANGWLGTFDLTAPPLPIQVENDSISYTP